MAKPVLQRATEKGASVLCGGCYEKMIPYWGLPYSVDECLCDECMETISEMIAEGTL